MEQLVVKYMNSYTTAEQINIFITFKSYIMKGPTKIIGLSVQFGQPTYGTIRTQTMKFSSSSLSVTYKIR